MKCKRIHNRSTTKRPCFFFLLQLQLLQLYVIKRCFLKTFFPCSIFKRLVTYLYFCGSLSFIFFDRWCRFHVLYCPIKCGQTYNHVLFCNLDKAFCLRSRRLSFEYIYIGIHLLWALIKQFMHYKDYIIYLIYFVFIINISFICDARIDWIWEIYIYIYILSILIIVKRWDTS